MPTHTCMRRAFPQEKWSSYLDEAEEAMAGAGIDKNCPGVKKFLNRLLGMPVQMQNKIFTHFMAMLEEKVSEQASRELTRGQGPTGLGVGRGGGSVARSTRVCDT